MPASILIVDDEPALTELFVIGLCKYGFQTDGVLGGRECLEKLQNDSQPDLIILDMMMEPMDGWETLLKLKNNGKYSNIPVILQTGKNLTYKEAEQFSFRIEDYIMKPITPKRCVIHIQAVFQKEEFIRKMISAGISRGYAQGKIDRLVQLYRALDVSAKLLLILRERYGSHKMEGDEGIFGINEYERFINDIRIEYDQLRKELQIPIE